MPSQPRRELDPFFLEIERATKPAQIIFAIEPYKAMLIEPSIVLPLNFMNECEPSFVKLNELCSASELFDGEAGIAL